MIGEIIKLGKVKSTTSLWKRIKYPSRPSKQQSRLRSISKLRQKRLVMYRKMVKAWALLKENRTCRYPGCNKGNPDVHHSRGRAGALLLETRFWIPLCRRHHEWIGAHPRAAREVGLLAEVGQWNVMPKVK